MTTTFPPTFAKSANEYTDRILDEIAQSISVIETDGNGDDIDPVLIRIMSNGSPIAFFPNTCYSERQSIDSYMIVGQHGEACMGYLHECVPCDFQADPSQSDQVTAILQDLRNCGYNPVPKAW